MTGTSESANQCRTSQIGNPDRNAMLADALEYACSLVKVPSASRQSNVQVSDVVQGHLAVLGFQIERQEFLDAQGIRKVNIVGKPGNRHRRARLLLSYRRLCLPTLGPSRSMGRLSQQFAITACTVAAVAI